MGEPIEAPASIRRGATLLALILGALLLGGCATNPAGLTDPERDPWERFNRKVHSFNMGFDRALAKPVAKAYTAVVPEAPRRGVRNFFRNLSWPVTFLNLMLQGKFTEGMTSTGRFMINSTVGLAGFFDVAGRAGIPFYEEDMGQTLAVWGWKNSRFVMMPFLGPYTARDLLGRSFYGYFHPISYMIREHNVYWPLIVDLVTLRASILPLDEDLDSAADPYVLLRDVYLQRREFLIFDGDPPAPDYESMMEDLEEY